MFYVYNQNNIQEVLSRYQKIVSVGTDKIVVLRGCWMDIENFSIHSLGGHIHTVVQNAELYSRIYSTGFCCSCYCLTQFPNTFILLRTSSLWIFFMLHSPLKIVLLVCSDTSGFGRTKWTQMLFLQDSSDIEKKKIY